MKKIGLLCLALVLALGALGVGYAAWTDQITISGTVNTGSVDIDAVYFSGCIIYKYVPDHSTVEYRFVKNAGGDTVWQNMDKPVESPTTYVKIAEAYAAPDGDDAVTVTVNGAFPYAYLTADCIIHCDGSVPVIVTYDIDTTDEALAWLWNEGYAGFYACEFDIIDVPTWNVVFGQTIGDWIQMHYCDYAKFWLYLDLPQEAELVGTPYTQEDFMGKTWHFTAHFNAIQWNESDVFDG